MIDQISKDTIPGPKQPPRIHGDGCTCGDFARYGCPAAATYKPTPPQEALTKENQAKAHECGSCGRRWFGGYDHCCACAESVTESKSAEIASLTARCRELETDAKRYRWLREESTTEIQTSTWCALLEYDCFGESMDALIDAALSQGAKP